jgi:hypothetical protein
VGSMHDTVADRVGDGRIPDHRVPLSDRQLRGQKRGGASVAVFEDLQEDQTACRVQNLQL